jgi:hypothetical protein
MANLAVALLGLLQEQRLASSLDWDARAFGPRLDLLGLAVSPWFAL